MVKVRLNEADSDYIQVGGKTYPLDATEYGYASADEVSRRAKSKWDAEKAAEQAEKDRQEAERQRQDFIAAHEGEISEARAILEGTDTADDKLFAIQDAFVPQSGKSDTVGGEIARAYCKIEYRRWNDGDLYYEGYGLETCGSSVEYLIDNTDDKIAKLLKTYPSRHMADWQINDESYKEFIEVDLANAIVDYLLGSLELFATPNDVDSRSYGGDYIEDWEEEGRCHDYDADLGQCDDFRRLYEAGILDASDVEEDFIEDGDWVRYDVDVYANGDYIEITGLSRDDLNEFESNFYRAFERWASEKLDEHIDEVEAYEGIDEDEYIEDEE